MKSVTNVSSNQAPYGHLLFGELNSYGKHQKKLLINFPTTEINKESIPVVLVR